MQSNKPWKLVKSGVESEHSRAGSVVGLCVNAACLLSVIMSPFMPGRVARLNRSKFLKSVKVEVQLGNYIWVNKSRMCTPSGLAKRLQLQLNVDPDTLPVLGDKFR